MKRCRPAQESDDGVADQVAIAALKAAAIGLQEIISQLKQNESNFSATNLPVGDAVVQIVRCLEGDEALLNKLVAICEDSAPLNKLAGIAE